MNWEGLAGWWRSELAGDPSYAEEIEPIVMRFLDPIPGHRYLDVGCGDGRLMAAIARSGAEAIGVDIAGDLLREAVTQGPVVRLRLPDLSSFRTEAFDGAYVSLVLEHIEDHRRALAEIARVVRANGALALVINHPTFTAPSSAPVDDGEEVLWRPGRYFGMGSTEEPVSDGTITFYHRPMADLLNAASDAGWDLQRMEERGASGGQISRYPALARQRHVPRLLAVRWTRRPL